MKSVLIAIPCKPSMPDILQHRMMELVCKAVIDNSDFDIDVALDIEHFEFTGREPYAYPQATARNALLDKYLQPYHDLVMWIDADLVDYPSDIIIRLDAANPGGVTAPMVLIENSQQFYDTYGYVQDGHHINAFPPYLHPLGELVEMDAVGCAYLIPADVYRPGRYSTTPGHTEHYSICKIAKEMGLKIVCNTTITIYHADLSKYGLQWHGH